MFDQMSEDKKFPIALYRRRSKVCSLTRGSVKVYQLYPLGALPSFGEIRVPNRKCQGKVDHGYSFILIALNNLHVQLYSANVKHSFYTLLPGRN